MIPPPHFLREARKVPDNESDDESDDASCGGEASGRLCFAGLPRSLGIHYPDLHCPGNEDELLSTPLGAGFDPSTGPLTTAFQNGPSGHPPTKRPWRTYKENLNQLKEEHSKELEDAKQAIHGVVHGTVSKRINQFVLPICSPRESSHSAVCLALTLSVFASIIALYKHRSRGHVPHSLRVKAYAVLHDDLRASLTSA